MTIKKWMIACCTVIVLAVAGVYLFIPSTLDISVVKLVKCSINGTFIGISDQKKWQEWFPKDAVTNRYAIVQQLHNAAIITIDDEGESINSSLVLLPVATDSTGIQWSCAVTTGSNPIKRIQRYWKAVAIRDEMKSVLDQLGNYVSKSENVYAFPMQRIKFTDSVLVATRTITHAYPTTAEIYRLVDLLQTHIEEKNAHLTGSPMLNVSQLDSNRFQVMVALPVDRMIEDEKSFFSRRMVPGYFIRADVKGGPGTLKIALQQLRQYLADYRHTAMAIPFEYLETDRSREVDTAKWITRIYVPVP